MGFGERGRREPSFGKDVGRVRVRPVHRNLGSILNLAPRGPGSIVQGARSLAERPRSAFRLPRCPHAMVHRRTTFEKKARSGRIAPVAHGALCDKAEVIRVVAGLRQRLQGCRPQGKRNDL